MSRIEEDIKAYYGVEWVNGTEKALFLSITAPNVTLAAILGVLAKILIKVQAIFFLA